MCDLSPAEYFLKHLDLFKSLTDGLSVTIRLLLSQKLKGNSVPQISLEMKYSENSDL